MSLARTRARAQLARAIVSRFLAGEHVVHLARDYDAPAAYVEACIRWSLRRYRGAPPAIGEVRGA